MISTRVTRVASLIVLTLEGKKLPSKRLILEEQGGGYRVDWEAFVLWQDRPWAEIPSMEEGETCEIRCLARPLPNNHPSRRAEEGWLAYELVNPVTHEILFGFFQKKEGHAADSPAEVFAKGSSGPVTLLLKPIVGESGTDQVMISEVLALGWVYPLPEGHRKK